MILFITGYGFTVYLGFHLSFIILTFTFLLFTSPNLISGFIFQRLLVCFITNFIS